MVYLTTFGILIGTLALVMLVDYLAIEPTEHDLEEEGDENEKSL